MTPMPPQDRRASWTLALGMGALALILAGIAGDSLVSYMRALDARATVEVRTGSGAAVVGAVQLVLLTGVLLHPSPPGRTALLRAVLWLSPLLVLLPLTLLLASNALLPERGYVRCPPQSGQRFVTSIWVPNGTICSGRG